ncbi:MAG: ADOP family duplicated permease [Gemmatimonadaceae bacterium]
MSFASLAQDLKYAIRGLRTKPAFASAIVCTLGLGIGANAAMFGVVDRLLFRAPPLMREPTTAHRVYLFQTFRGKERASTGGQYARYADVKRWTRSFSSVAGFTAQDHAVGLGDATREMRIGIVSASFFGFFDAPPAIGRYFSAAEDTPPTGAPVVVLSHTMWQSQYGGRRDVLGTRVQIGPTLYTVIGVAPKGFVGLWPDRPPAAFISLTSHGDAQRGGRSVRPMSAWWETYSWGWLAVMVRRNPGVTLEAANADLTNAFLKSLDAQRVEQPTSTAATPLDLMRPRAEAWSILPDRGPNAGAVSKVARWVGGVSFIVLLIACANVANLLLARALRRRREIALRLALGMSRARLTSQLLTESVLLALLGGVAGLSIAHWGGTALRAAFVERSEAPAGLSDPRTVLYATAAAIGVGLLTGLAPIFSAGRVDLTSDLKAGAREGTSGRSRTRVALLVIQGTLSVVLLVGAGLFVRSLWNVQSMRWGYDVDPVLVVGTNMRGTTLDSATLAALWERLLAAGKAIQGVENASLQDAVPFWNTSSTSLFVEGIDTVSRLGQFNFNKISPEHFATVGTRIIRGRGISRDDVAGAPGAMVVSESMAKTLWPGKDAIGQCIRVRADTMPCTYVVGIAENIKAGNLTEDPSHYYYVPATQVVRTQGLFVRTRGNAKKLQETVRRRLQREMPGASYVTVMPFSDIVGSQKRSWNLGATMFTAFGVLALVLAAIGLYSVIAYNVAQRTHELGVRRALGAQTGDVVRMVVVDGVRLASIGIAIGVALALGAGRWVQPLLFGVSPKDPFVFTLVATVLVAVAIGASWLPALRASRVDPNVALRTE